MKTNAEVKFIIGLIIVGLFSALCLGILYNRLVKRVSCSDFINFNEAQKFFKNGATWLDRNKNGIACENLSIKKELVYAS